MRVDLYTRCWNDGLMLPFFFRHYDDLVQRYVVYDDGSTDNSLELLRAHPRVEIRPMPPYSVPESRVESNHAVLEHCWQESRGVADWVIVTDVDEHLYHRDLRRYLARCLTRGVTIIPALGYAMLSWEFPSDDVRLSTDVTMGAPEFGGNKLSIFSPKHIRAVDWELGRHSARPTGEVIAPARDQLLLLHYKYVGFERVQQRHELYRTRQRARDLENGWGYQYAFSREELRAQWDDVRARLVDISRSDLRPWKSHPEARWWDGVPREKSWPRRVWQRLVGALRPSVT